MTYSFYNWLTGVDVTSKVQVALYQGTVNPDVPHVLSDITEADFPGYTRQAFFVHPGSARTAPSAIACSGNLAVFSFAGEGDEANNIGGFMLVATLADASQKLVTYEAFTFSVFMNADAMPIGVAPYVLTYLASVA